MVQFAIRPVVGNTRSGRATCCTYDTAARAGARSHDNGLGASRRGHSLAPLRLSRLRTSHSAQTSLSPPTRARSRRGRRFSILIALAPLPDTPGPVDDERGKRACSQGCPRALPGPSTEHWRLTCALPRSPGWNAKRTHNIFCRAPLRSAHGGSPAWSMNEEVCSRALPRFDAGDLLGARVDAVAEGLVDDHRERSDFFRASSSTRRTNSETHTSSRADSATSHASMGAGRLKMRFFIGTEHASRIYDCQPDAGLKAGVSDPGGIR